MDIDRILSIVLIIAIILAIVMTVYVIVTPKQGEKFTEFYILGLEGMADDYPMDLAVGEEGEVIIGVVNHEYTSITYLLEVTLNETVMGEEELCLEHNETWEQPFFFEATKNGEDQKVEFCCTGVKIITNLARPGSRIDRSTSGWTSVEGKEPLHPIHPNIHPCFWHIRISFCSQSLCSWQQHTSSERGTKKGS